jgi:hypothetical protein
MFYISGAQSIGNGVDSLTVSWGPFEDIAAIPDVVLLSVHNDSADTTKLPITALVTDKTINSFDVALSQTTNTANYELIWYASYKYEFIPTEITGGEIISAKPVLQLETTSSLNDSDFLIVGRTTPTNTTKRISWSSLSGLVSKITDVPSLPTDPGSPGNIALGSDGVYIHNGVEWLYFPADVDTF